MKAMKKVLFLMLVLAMALTAVAFADTCDHTWTDKATHLKPGETATGYKCDENGLATEITTSPAAKTPTAYAGGIDVWTRTCTKCEILIWDSETLPAAYPDVADHEHIFVKKVNPDAANTTVTCSKDGVAKFDLVCNVPNCNVNNGSTTETTTAYGHKLVDWAYDFFGYVKSETISDAQAKELEHFFGWIKSNWEAAGIGYGETGLRMNVVNLSAKYTPVTCAKDGKLEIKCAECNKVVFIATVPATGAHDYEIVNDASANTAPTCTENGLVVAKCKNCGATKNEVIEAPGHEYIYAVMQNGEIVKPLIAAKNDAEALTEAKAKMPDCQEYTVVKVCDNYEIEEEIAGTKVTVSIIGCGDTQIVKNVKPVWNHDDITVENYKNLIAAGQFVEFAKAEGNCTNESYIIAKCSECDAVKKLVLKAAGHDWDAIENGTVKKAATCTAEGEMIVKCKNYDACKATTIMTIEKKDHSTYTTTQNATDCTTTGTITTKCNVCNQTLKTEIIPAGHVFETAVRKNMVQVKGKWIVEDCTKVATETGYCTRCKLANQTNTYEAKAAHSKAAELILGKNYWVVEKATCQNTGVEEFDCATCEKTFTETVPVTAHFADATKLVDVAVLKAATCTAEGTKLVKCSATCSETKEAPISKAAHEYEYKNNKLVCKNCGATEKMVDGHDYKIDTTNVNLGSKNCNGIGVVTTKDNSKVEDHTGILYARVNWGFTNADGETIAVVTNVKVNADGTFDMVSPSAPHGYELTNCTVVVTTARNAAQMLLADVPNCGTTVLR